MRLIREAMHERAGAAFERFDDARGNEHGTERRVAAGDSLPDQNNVRLNVPMLDGKRFSGAAHAGHDFVSDQKNAVFAENLGDARGVAFGRHGGAKRGANDRFEDKSGCLLSRAFEQMDLQIVGTRKFALRKRLFEWAVIAKTRRNVTPFGEERFIRRAASDVSADGHRAERAAVIALAPRENVEAFLLSGFEMILTREFYRGFRGFRAAGSEIDAAA